MPSKSYLAVDLGAESGRVIVGVLEDGRLTLHEAHRFLHRPVDLPSGLHWDLTGLWHNILEGIRYVRGGFTTHSVVMRSKSGTVRYVKALHPSMDKFM